MKKIIALILIAVAVCAIASVLARSRRTEDGEEQDIEATSTVADEGVLEPEASTPPEAEAETEAVSEPA